MAVRGIRGATTAETDTRESILTSTRELLNAIVQANRLDARDIASVMFTTTKDLCSEYPARAARDLGWHTVPLLGGTEMDLAGGIPRCIRVLLLVNTRKAQASMKHIYLREARALRPDR